MRPTGVTIVAGLFVAYGAITLLAFAYGLAVANGPPPVIGVSLGVVVALLAVFTGLSLWQLAPRARHGLLLWATTLAGFNAWLISQFERPIASATWVGLTAGFLTGLIVVILLYRYFGRVCTPAA